MKKVSTRKSARSFRENVTRDLANDELRANFRGAMDYLVDKRKQAFFIGR